MKPTTQTLNAADKPAEKRKAGCVAARLTAEQQQRVEAAAEARGLTVSQWLGIAISQALETSLQEQRLLLFLTAETASIRLALEAWQGAEQLADEQVQRRIEWDAAKAARSALARMANRLTTVEQMEAPK